MGSLAPLSLADCSVLYHAVDLKGVVISGDSKLRREASAQHIEVHGTPWILAQLVANKGISPSCAIDKMEALLEVNPRLPIKECRKLQDAWRLQLSSKTSKTRKRDV